MTGQLKNSVNCSRTELNEELYLMIFEQQHEEIGSLKARQIYEMIQCCFMKHPELYAKLIHNAQEERAKYHDK